MSKTEVIEQMEFVNALTKKLSEAVTLHEKRRTEKEQKHHYSVAEWGQRYRGAWCFQSSDHGKRCPAPA